MPKPNKPRRPRSNASGSPIVTVGAMETIAKDTLALTVLELLKDNAVVATLKATLFPVKLNESIKNLTAKVVSLTNELENKQTQIVNLENRVDSLEKAADDGEQYSRRPNLRFHGFLEADTAENTDQMIINLVNSELNVHPPMQIDHLERSHRLGPKVGGDAQPRQRPIIARFRSERLRDAVYRSRFNLNTYNDTHRECKIFINEDLTARRAALARNTRSLKKERKLSDCWTTGGNVMVKELDGKIRQVKTEADLKKY